MEFLKRKRKNSKGLATMAGNTAKLARQMMVLDKTEAALDREMQHEAERGEPTTKVQRVRRKGEKALHTKYVLLAVVILNIIDCLLVLGELMLDIKYVTDLLTKEYDRSDKFIGEMKLLYPARLGRLEDDDIVGLQHQILIGHTVWDSATNSSGQWSAGVHTRRRRAGDAAENATAVGNEKLITHVHYPHTIEEQIAIVFHKASISILGILCVEILVKIFCLGKELLHHKLECFDAFVVIASFVIDLVFLGGLQDYAVQEYMLILAFMVPWRIIRVVNSLVVASMDHQHLRLVILYKQKKQTAKELQEVKDENKGLEACIDELGKLCASAGIPDTHVKAKLNMYRRAKPKTIMMGVMSCFAFGGEDMDTHFKVGLPMTNGHETVNLKTEQNHTAKNDAMGLQEESVGVQVADGIQEGCADNRGFEKAADVLSNSCESLAMAFMKRRRKNTMGLATLAGNTAKMAQQMMVLDKTEASLDREIQHEAERGEPTTKVQRVRRKGEKALHTKYVLLAVVILNIIDCLLVLGELMLDIKYVTDLLTKEYDRSEKFIGEMKLLYPARLGRLEDDDIVGLQHQILIGHTVWDSAINSSSHSAERHTRRRRTGVTAEHPTGSGVGNETLITHVHHAHSIEEQIAHGLHKASISILGILCVEILVKIVCLGKELLHHKLECFDAFVVIASFVVDLVFLGGLQDFEVQEFVLILAFMVPWRIIRVVNSLVVAIMDHEHLRLVILYKQKKKTAKELQEVKDENKGLEACISELGKLCESAGIPDTHVKAKLNMYRKVKAKTNMMGAMSSFAIGGDAMNNPFKVGLPKSNGNVTINVENEQNHTDTASTTAENLEDVTTIANETSKTANATGSNLTNSASPRLPRGLLDDRPRSLSVIEVREMDEKPRRNSFLAELAENSAAFMATISDDTETHFSSHPPVRGEEAEVGITKLGVTEDRGETLTDDSFNSKTQNDTIELLHEGSAGVQLADDKQNDCSDNKGFDKTTD
ncbi:uncharacterized protein LOC128231058 [Mya arenaria]|uniref:uncharacterized protein LOC128231058 n=1 Tax=Mya arenaria TaxID=6604 RepID=UPI0022E92283|nr:uncharacterized protein LOC128231058 [Mya arenaria]